MAKLAAPMAPHACERIYNTTNPPQQSKYIANAETPTTIQDRRKGTQDEPSDSEHKLTNDAALNLTDLPSEIKNKIYRYLLNGKNYIQTDMSLVRGRKLVKHNLSSQILRVNSTIYHEALPILLSNNIFELSIHLDKYLTFDLKLPPASNRIFSLPQRIAMVRTVAVHQTSFTANRQRVLRKLKGLRRFILFTCHCWRYKGLNPNGQSWKRDCKSEFERDDALQRKFSSAYLQKPWPEDIDIYHVTSMSFLFTIDGVLEEDIRRVKWRVVRNNAIDGYTIDFIGMSKFSVGLFRNWAVELVTYGAED